MRSVCDFFQIANFELLRVNGEHVIFLHIENVRPYPVKGKTMLDIVLLDLEQVFARCIFPAALVESLDPKWVQGVSVDIIVIQFNDTFRFLLI